jgi:hypothetical protein
MYLGGERQSATCQCWVSVFCIVTFVSFDLNENLNEINILCHVLLFYDDLFLRHY